MKYRWSGPRLVDVVKHLEDYNTRPEKPINLWEENVPTCMVYRVNILVVNIKINGVI